MRLTDVDALEQTFRRWLAAKDYNEAERHIIRAAIGQCQHAPAIQLDVPRVMTLEEVKASVGRDVWLELFGLWNKKDILTATTICACGDHSLCTQYESLSYENYGAKYGWRMWIARPTDEQREAEPWNG